MNMKLTVAVAAATLVTAPVAMAQTTPYATSPYGSDMSQQGYERSSGSGLPTTSPQVRSMPGSGAAGSTAPYGAAAPYDSPSARGTSTYGQSGSTGPADRMPGAMGSGSGMGQGNRQVLMNVDRTDATQRRGTGQRNKELMQTTMLNQFAAAGFTSVRDFRKQGDNYIAEAQNQDGTWTTVELNPSTGTISALR